MLPHLTESSKAPLKVDVERKMSERTQEWSIAQQEIERKA